MADSRPRFAGMASSLRDNRPVLLSVTYATAAHTITLLFDRNIDAVTVPAGQVIINANGVLTKSNSSTVFAGGSATVVLAAPFGPLSVGTLTSAATVNPTVFKSGGGAGTPQWSNVPVNVVA